MSVCCRQDERREAVRRMKGWNGIDYVEVARDRPALFVYFLGRLPPELAVDEPGLERFVRIEGGERITGITVEDVDPVVADDPEKDDYLVVHLDKSGDFSRYTLRLVGVDKVDSRYDSATFVFNVDCPQDLDCAPACACEPAVFEPPEINYLAKDYASFRQLILDRMALLVPGWRERHAPDLGIALVELLAYEGDYLSYYQDAVATEAYLDTARRRISVRRHVRLVDYLLHEGCNARAFLALETDTEDSLPADVSFVTGLGGAFSRIPALVTWDDLRDVPSDAYEVFEPFDRERAMKVYPAHNEIHVYTWGRRQCCLERGATSATLIDTGLHVKPGDVLIFEEVLGPVTGLSADADPSHRHAVRVTAVAKGLDRVVPMNGHPTRYLEVTWADADKLPFPICISAIGAAPACTYLENVSVVRGNVVLVDHGRSYPPEDLGTIPTELTKIDCICEGRASDSRTIPGRADLRIAKAPLTFRAPLSAGAPAAALLKQDPRAARPQLNVTSVPPAAWECRIDLLASRGTDPHIVAEIDNEGVAHLRFGDGELGMCPAAGTAFAAACRIGNGVPGNVGAESICRIVLGNETMSGVRITVRNPIPAAGGIDPESIVDAKLLAPHHFRTRIERAITAEDYETLAERNSAVQSASTELVWTGSWYEADVAIDPYGSEGVSDKLLSKLAAYLERYRRMGHDLHLEPAVYVPLDLELKACALPGYQREHVRAALLDVFSNRTLAGGVKGFFHPDEVSFGEDIFLSEIVAKALAVPGVECVSVAKCERLFEGSNQEIENGVFPLAPHEIVRLDNDPNYPEHGQLVIKVSGGR